MFSFCFLNDYVTLHRYQLLRSISLNNVKMFKRSNFVWKHVAE